MSDTGLPPAVQMFNQPSITAAEIAEALVEANGNISVAARELGMRRGVLMDRINSNADLVTTLSDLREALVDKAEENQLTRAIGGADPAAERFVLQTLGKSRGYSTAIGGMGAGGDIVVTIRKFSEDDGS